MIFLELMIYYFEIFSGIDDEVPILSPTAMLKTPNILANVLIARGTLRILFSTGTAPANLEPEQLDFALMWPRCCTTFVFLDF